MAETIIPHWLSKQAELKPNQVAIELVNGSKMTFKELCDQSKSYARKLAHLGISKGSHVGILSTNHSSMVITIHALSYLGAVIVLLNTKLTNRELQYQIDDAEISTLLYLDVLAEKATHIQTNTMKSFTEVNSRSEEHTSELQSRFDLVCRLLL